MDHLVVYFVLVTACVAADQPFPTPEVYRSRREGGSKVVTACLLAERNTVGIIYDYNRAQAAVDMAVQYVNEFVLVGNYRLHVIYRDIGNECGNAITHVVGHAMDLMQKGIHCDVYIGPGCGVAAESLNGFAEYYDIPIIGCPAAGLGLSAPSSDYTVVVRVSITYSTIAETLIRFFHHYNYTSPFFIEDTTVNFYQQMAQLVMITIKLVNPTLFYASKFEKFESDSPKSQTQIRTLLQNASDVSRVIVIFSNADTVRSFLIAAEEMDMTGGGYVYICVELYTSGVFGTFHYLRNDSYDQVAQEAFKSLLVLSISLGQDDETVIFWKKVVEYSRDRYNYTITRPNEIDPVVGHFYDAVLLYANLINDMTKARKDFRSGVTVATYVAGYKFFSPINKNVTFTEDSDRIFDYMMRNQNHETYKFDTFLEFPGSDNISESDIKTLGELEWFGATTLPDNMPRCGFKGNDPVCNAERSALQAGALVAAIVVPIVFVVGSAAIIFFLIRKYLKSHSDPYWWRILSFEMDFPADKAGGTSSKSLTKGSQKTIESTKLKENVAFEKEFADDESEVVSVHTESVGATAMYHGTPVSLLVLPEPRRRVPANLPREAALLRPVLHGNVQKFIGVALSDTGICEYIVGEICQKGSLRDLMASTMNLDWEFKHSLIKDISNGMTYLHASPVVSHGFLDDSNCLVEARFVLKISGFGFPSLRDPDELQPVIPNQGERDFHSLLWRAPELLRRVMPSNGTQKGDVYSFAILLQQIILRSEPFQQKASETKRKFENLGQKEIVFEVRKGMSPPLRPPVPMSACSKGLHQLMEDCWDEDPQARPTFFKIRTTAIKVIGRSGDNIVDYLIRQMERHATELEEQVDKQMKQFMYERQRSADLLSVMLPKAVADALTKGLTILPETYDSTTVYFGDVAGFAEAIAQTTSPFGIVDILNGLYSVCDNVISEFDVFKVETVSDAYLLVSGLPVRNGKRHIEEITSLSLALRRDISTMKLDAAPNVSFKLRVGINSGSCVAGVIGSKMPRYCLFGDTVNTASRMESHGEAGKIHLSASSYEILKDVPEYIMVPRGVVNIKGKGPMETYWLVGKTN